MTTFKADGSMVGWSTTVDMTAFFMDKQDRLVVARNGTLVTARADAIQLVRDRARTTSFAPSTIPAVLANDKGERIIANIKQRNVIRALPNGRFVALFAQGQVTRMAKNWLGDIAMINRSNK
ncbi:MAG: hypothetical protein QM736_14025 [Vicinamibacterales bacterium]